MNMAFELNSDKKILLHIGPPKTGSSAIQKCFSDNRNALLESGIFYPAHLTDANGISSGHQETILSPNDRGEFVIDRAKIAQVIAQFTASPAHTMVLSSEAFFRRAGNLVRILPNCEVIAFVRNPIDFIESQYNQSVKRHMNASKIELPSKLGVGQIKALTELLEENESKTFHLHTYLRGEDIIDKFASLVGVHKSLTKPKNQVNSSYTHEALQFKRMINTFSLAKIDAELDRALQGYTEGCSEYTYIPQERYLAYQKYCKAVLDEFCSKFEVHGSSDLFAELTLQRSEVEKQQTIEPDELRALIQFLKSHHRTTFKKLRKGLIYAGSDKQDVQSVVEEVLGVNFRWW